MKRFLQIFVLLLAAFGFSACSVRNVNGDEIAVKIHQPWIFGHGGVDQAPEYPGSFGAWWSTKVVFMKAIPVKRDIAFDDLFTQSKEPVDISAYVVIQIKKELAPKLYSDAGVDWYENRIERTFSSYIRDNAKSYTMPAIVSDPAVVPTIEKKVLEELRSFVTSAGLPIDILEVGINKASPNPDVLEEINRTSQQNQRNRTETERASAELTRKAAEQNKAAADRAYREHFGMTNMEYLKLRELEIEKEKLEVVRGKDNVTIILNSGAVPTFNAAR